MNMGHVVHNAIVVTSFDAKMIRHAYLAANKFRLNPSPIVRSDVNSYDSFLVPTDGSKSGWADSDTGDKRRAKFKDWLRAQQYDDGSSCIEWVEVTYSSDDRTAKVIDSEWHKPKLD